VKKILLSVAGYDPTSGAGIALDLKVFQKHGYLGMGILTSLTSQNTQTVKKVHCPSSRFLSEEYRHLSADVAFSGIKVGMIGCAENINAVRRILTDNPHIPIVIDPVFKSSGGTWLIEKRSIPAFIAKIRSKASLLTPNLVEAEWISGLKTRNLEEMLASAEKIYAMTSIPCLIKGGHLRDLNVDVLFDGKTHYRFNNKKLKKTVHGTGCFLSSTILCHLVGGSSLELAVSLAIKATRRAIKESVPIGKGQLIIADVPEPELFTG
jgi:hydroxymethylpyrimidine/phosphomethylpyrimidine kinase